MFFRTKKSGPRAYLQIVENHWRDGRPQQTVLATVGRLDELQANGQVDALLTSGARFAQKLLILSEHKQGKLPVIRTRRWGAPLVFEKLWQETGCQAVLRELLRGRHFEFPVERAVFLTVLHRLLAPGSDRAADHWKADYVVKGIDKLNLHHLYRAMGWLGQHLPDDHQQGSTKLVPRCTKDLIEEQLFGRRRDLFTEVEVVFFDTTSLYFEGQGGETLGQYGHSKDHRPDEHQMVVGAVLDGDGRPICCELWPGNTTDVTTLIPIVDRLWRRFKIKKVCIVADRGMISQGTIEDLEQQGWPYILGARMRKQNEVRQQVLEDRRRFRVVHEARQQSTDPAPLKVKDVWVQERRYVVCINEEEVEHDRAARAAIVANLREQLRAGDKSLVGNKGYRRFLKIEGEGHFAIDDAKIQEEARFDGTWVLRTNTELPAADVALQFKRLWMVEQWFRSCKSLLETRPIYHHCDETIRGHVFCSFLALVLRYELQARLQAKKRSFEWADVIRDLEQVQQVEIEHQGHRFLLRSQLSGSAGRVFQAAAVAVPPTVQQVN
ncbi:MAG: IS1634 family transposase [Actinobacteria bacterium]|nr:IS1634 family transposase [Actinomycetota bacterium]